MKPTINKTRIKEMLKFLGSFLMLNLAGGVYGQTLLPQQVQTGTLSPGQYYRPDQIQLSAPFSFTASADQSLLLYIADPTICNTVLAIPSWQRNFVATFMPRDSGIFNVFNQNISTCAMTRSVQYIDGLGRSLQNVIVKGNGDATKDLVQPSAYDQYGRAAIQYLPYTTAAGYAGSYRPNALDGQGGYGNSEQKIFYGLQGENYKDIPSPFAKTGFEPSPLNRVVEQGAPGNTWQVSGAGSSGSSGHTLRTIYGSNDQTTAFNGTSSGSKTVALYQATTNSNQTKNLIRGNNNATYETGQLSLTILRDENWQPSNGCVGTVEEYKDKEGRVILKRTYNLTSTSQVEMLSTYYVHDEMGRLAFVLTPKTEPDNTGTPISAGKLENLCYQYRYDERGRMTQKKLPGKGWEYFVYNKLDQLVASQDANQRNKANQDWTVTKYDELDRSVITGIYQYGATANQDYRSVVQGLVNAVTNSWESYIGVTANNGYTNDAFPATMNAVLSVNYYGTYNVANIPAYLSPPGATSRLTGLLTVSKVNVLGTSNMLWNINYYDEDGRAIRSYKQHYLNATASEKNYDELNTVYNFTGQPTTITRKHFTNGVTGTGGTLTQAVTVTNRYTYDHMGRKVKSYQRTGTASSPEVVVSANTYNETGQLYVKKLHSDADDGNYLQTVSFKYNERGWFKSGTSSLFSNELKYEDAVGGVDPQFNGNIANQKWGAGSTLGATFDYIYDKLNRLRSGISTGAPANMSENGITYDKMGNILSLTRDGALYGYNYTYNSFDGNQLNTVAGLTTGNYHYDANGNMDIDARTGVNLTYNLLNLPQTVLKSGLNLSYVYSALGEKLRKVSSQSGTTDYIGGIQYATVSSNYVIDFVPTEEGRAKRRSDGTYYYEYDLADHLGNVRVTFLKGVGGAAEKTQADNYYAFGMRKSVLQGSFVNKYLYNKKELQEETGNYDYGARHYDPVIARWTAPDPMAEKYRRWSPYNYVMNNPIRFIDPDGMDPYSESKANDQSRKKNEEDQKAAEGADGLTNDEWMAANRAGDWDFGKIGNQDSGDNNTQTGSDTTKRGGKTANKGSDCCKTHEEELAEYGKIVFASNISLQISIVGGVAIEYGTVSTAKGWNQKYRTVYPAAYGLGRSLTGSISIISSKNATFSDWAGSYLGGSVGFGVFGVLAGSSSAYSVYGVSAGYTVGGRTYRGISGAFVGGETVLMGRPYYRNPYTFGNGPYSNTYYGGLIGL